MEFKASQIASILGGTIEGNPEAAVTTLSKIEEGKTGSLSFLSNPAYNAFLYTTDATIVIVNNDFKPEQAVRPTCTLIRVPDARMAFGKLLELYQQSRVSRKGIEQPVSIAPTAEIGKEVYIGAFSYIGSNARIGNNVKLYPQVYIGDNVVIGDNTILHPGVKIYHDCKVGANSILHGGVVIGGDGFGFTPNQENDYKKVVHMGNVVVEDWVEIGSNTTIDRATLGSTIIRKGVKLDNLIQVAHNVEIGENTVIAAQTGVSGSTKIGKNVMIGGQVGLVGHIRIADGVKIAAQSGVGNSIIQEGAVVQGSPAYTIGEYKRSYVLFRKLPEMNEQIKQLEKLLQELKQSAEK